MSASLTGCHQYILSPNLKVTSLARKTKRALSWLKTLLEKENERLNGQFSFPISLNLADDMSDKFSIVTTNGGVGLILVLIV